MSRSRKTSSSLRYVGSKRLLYRARELDGTLTVPAKWMVTNHPEGAKSFSDWNEAIKYASHRYYLMNNVRVV